MIHCVSGEKVPRERRWTSAGATPARELVRSTRQPRLPHPATTGALFHNAEFGLRMLKKTYSIGGQRQKRPEFSHSQFWIGLSAERRTRNDHQFCV
jgi:hypothetical protein